METLVKLSKIQGELKAPKSQRNSFGKYNYRSCEDILESVKPLLEKYGACLVLEDEPVQSGEYHYIKATATIYDSESGDKISNTAYAREPKQQSGMSDSQLTGTASSYARKYALNGLFCIDDTKDADTDEYQKQTASRANKPAQKQAEAETIPPCACCGKQLQPIQYNNRTVTPLETARSTKKRFGRVLCWDCAQKQPKEG